MTDQRAPILRYFAYSHLPPPLREVSSPFADLAFKMDTELPSGPEKSAGLRKLLEAKDCFVRAALDLPPALDPPPGGRQIPPAAQRVDDRL